MGSPNRQMAKATGLLGGGGKQLCWEQDHPSLVIKCSRFHVRTRARGLLWARPGIQTSGPLSASCAGINSTCFRPDTSTLDHRRSSNEPGRHLRSKSCTGPAPWTASHIGHKPCSRGEGAKSSDAQGRVTELLCPSTLQVTWHLAASWQQHPELGESREQGLKSILVIAEISQSNVRLCI